MRGGLSLPRLTFILFNRSVVLMMPVLLALESVPLDATVHVSQITPSQLEDHFDDPEFRTMFTPLEFSGIDIGATWVRFTRALKPAKVRLCLRLDLGEYRSSWRRMPVFIPPRFLKDNALECAILLPEKSSSEPAILTYPRSAFLGKLPHFKRLSIRGSCTADVLQWLSIKGSAEFLPHLETLSFAGFELNVNDPATDVVVDPNSPSDEEDSESGRAPTLFASLLAIVRAAHDGGHSLKRLTLYRTTCGDGVVDALRPLVGELLLK